MFDAWKQRQRQRLENRPERTVFYNIFATMMLVLAVELLMAVASILAINVTEQLDENAKDLLTMRVRNRASYVQEILRNAEDLEQLSEQITATTQQLLKSGDISLDTLDNSSEQSDALLVALAPQLLDTLRTKQVTGIFLILNTHDLDTCEVGKKMPGIYLRDMDPDARPSERNSDLLLERASATVVKELAIGTDKGWQPAFPYQGDTKGGILRTVFQTAYKSDAGLSAESYGRWTTNSYCLAGDDRHAIAYSMPLILPDGTVYGVVGVELLTDYLQTKLPFTELDEDKAGTYFIVTTTDDALTDGVLSLRKTVTSGEDLVTADAPLGVLNCRSDGNGGNWAELNGKRYAGYEIHMGRSEEARGALFSMGNVYGSYVHGIFDEQEVADTILKALCTKKGVSFESLGTFDARAYKERQYDLLADAVRAGLDMPLIYRILNREV